MEHGSDAVAIVQNGTFGSSTYKYVYQNCDHIGTGANGTVFRGTITNRSNFLEGHYVAVKVIRFDEQSILLTDGAKWTKLCQRLQQLPVFSHDHLVRYHQINITKGSLGGVSIELMMDYYGSDLRKLIGWWRQQKVLLSGAAAVSYIIQIAEGLQFLHDKCIIHGDIKPGNILTTQLPNGDRSMAICDLDDIVQMERDATCSHDINQLRGTPRYMSPEMLKKFVAMQNTQKFETPGRETDMWSLGCIMLELADCVVGNYQKWLCKGKKKTEVDDQINDQKFVALIIEGYVPFVIHTIPPYITANLQQCIRPTSADRVSARKLVQQMKLKEPAIVPHAGDPFVQNDTSVVHSDGPFVDDETFGSACQYYCNYSDFIARGAFGTVFQATVTHRKDFTGADSVAVKVVRFDDQSALLTDRTKWGKLRQRLKTLPELIHDHLVRYHKITIAEGRLRGVSVEMLMDYHTGGDLSLLIRNLRNERSLMSEAVAVSYTIQIAEGLHFLHENHIIHGDLKPRTILTTRSSNGDRKLAICRLDDIVQMERNVTIPQDITHLRGTYRYMSPEMLKKFVAAQEHENPGRKTDIWSLGCIMVELADCVVGNNQKWLRKGHEQIEVGEKVSDARFVQLILDGYVPYAIETIPPYLTANMQQCVRITSAERISASSLIQHLRIIRMQQLRPTEFIMICHFAHAYVYCCLFDHSMKRMTEFPLPLDLRDRALAYQFATFEKSLVCQAVKSRQQYETVVWNLEENVCQPFLFPGSLERMVCPIAIGDKIHFWGLDGRFKRLDLYDKTIAAQKLPSHPTQGFTWKLEIYGGVRYGDKIIYVGQHIAREEFIQLPTWVKCFDTVTGEWDSLPDLPDWRVNFAMVALQNAVYVLGGDNYESSLGRRSCLRLDLHSPIQWEKISELLQPRWDHSAFVADNMIYVFGGRGVRSNTLGTMEVYDTERDLWSSVSVAGCESSFQYDAVVSRAVNVTVSWPLSAASE